MCTPRGRSNLYSLFAKTAASITQEFFVKFKIGGTLKRWLNHYARLIILILESLNRSANPSFNKIDAT